MKTINSRTKKVLIIVLFIQLFLLLALRSPFVGVDTQGYLNLFNRTKLYSFWNFDYSRHEWGYLFLNKIFSFVNSDQVFIAILAFISLFLIFSFIYKESSIPWLSVYLFITMGFYTNSFNLLRQIIALGVIAISYKYLKENNFLKFVLTVIIASFFHVTALVFVLVYPIRNMKLNYKSLIMYTCTGIFLVFGGTMILNLAFAFISDINYDLESGGGFTLLFILVLVNIAGIIFSKNVLLKNNRNIILYNLLICGILVQLLALDFALFTRVTSYFRFFLIIFIPEILSSIKDVKLRIIGIYVIIVLTAIQYYITLNADLSGIIPYQLFFR